MNILEKLNELIEERGWTKYRLSRECGLNESTISNIFQRNSIPNILTLEAICHAFGITLSQFFAEGEFIQVTPEIQELLDNWISLTPEQKEAILLITKMIVKLRT